MKIDNTLLIVGGLVAVGAIAYFATRPTIQTPTTTPIYSPTVPIVEPPAPIYAPEPPTVGTVPANIPFCTVPSTGGRLPCDDQGHYLTTFWKDFAMCGEPYSGMGGMRNCYNPLGDPTCGDSDACKYFSVCPNGVMFSTEIQETGNGKCKNWCYDNTPTQYSEEYTRTGSCTPWHDAPRYSV